MGCPSAIAYISLLWVLFDCWRGQGYRLDCSAPPIQSANNGTCAHFKSYEFRDYGTDEVRYKEESGQQSPGAHLADASKVVFSFRWLKMICHDYHHTYAIFLARIHKSSKERKFAEIARISPSWGLNDGKSARIKCKLLKLHEQIRCNNHVELPILRNSILDASCHENPDILYSPHAQCVMTMETVIVSEFLWNI